MKNWYVVLLCLMTVSANANGDDGYAVSKIPAALLKNANVVKRFEMMRFEITEANKATFYRKVAFTILNEEGERWSSYAEGYDKLRSIESFEGTLFGADGKKIKSLKKGDIKDVSGSDDASFADDNRVKWHSFFYKVYPYTVEYEVEVKYKGTMFLNPWIPQERPVMGVQSSQLIVISPVNNPLHYKMYNYNGEPVITEEKGNKIYNWESKQILPEKSEYAAPAWHTITTSVYMATEKFMLEDYEGSNASWKDFGKFVYDLKKDKDVLPEDVKAKVHQLTDGVTDTKEKIRKLYEYMQQNSRYISIQLGVGGWQPFDAKYVGTKKYGDCKALSNFMYSLLKEAGIRSVYTVTGRGDDPNYLLTDLPSSQFNHVILFVPLEKDTTWLECTSQTYLPGYVGGDNCNRYSVAVDENGGTLIKTPRYGINENLQLRRGIATINENGDLDVAFKTNYQAVQQDRLHYFINGLSKDKLMEFLREDIELPTYDIKSFNYKTADGNLPQIIESLELIASNYATITGKRLFVMPNLITRSHNRPALDSARTFELEIDYGYKDIDSIDIDLPAGYEKEAMPQDVSITSKFGKYNSSVKLSGNKLFYYRNYEHYSGRFPATDYPDLVKFYEAIFKADRNKVVLVKSDASKKAF